MSKHCYTVLPRLPSEGSSEVLLPWSTATTYIITMKGSTRPVEHLLKITPRSFVVVNDGYKTCAKTGVNNPARDLLHANQFVFQLEQTNPGPVLVLEDDCELLSNDVNAFQRCIDMLERGFDAVSLGCHPLFSWPIDRFFARVLYGGLFHGVVYSSVGRRKMLDMLRCGKFSYIDHMPHDHFFYRKLRVIVPLVPLAGQILGSTENSSFTRDEFFEEQLYSEHRRYNCSLNARECLVGFHSHLVGGFIGEKLLLVQGLAASITVLLFVFKHKVRWVGVAASIGILCFALIVDAAHDVIFSIVARTLKRRWSEKK